MRSQRSNWLRRSRTSLVLAVPLALSCSDPSNTEKPAPTGRTYTFKALAGISMGAIGSSFLAGKGDNHKKLDAIGPMGGPAYDFDARDLRSPRPVAWPEYYDGMPLLYEWTRDYVKGIRLGADGEVASIEDVIPSIATDNPTRNRIHGLRRACRHQSSWIGTKFRMIAPQ